MLFPGRARPCGRGAIAALFAMAGCGAVGDGSSGDRHGADGGAGGDGDGGGGGLFAFDDRGFTEVPHGDGGEYRAVDATGDGRPDLVLVAANGDGTRALYLDTAGDDALSYVGAQWISPVADPSAEHRWMFADNDADGRADFIESTRNPDGSKEVHVSLAEGNGWAYVGQSYHHASMDGALDYLPMDIDGDRRIDWVQVGANGDGSRLLSPARATGDGSRLAAAGSYSTPAQDAGAVYRVANVNGDGTDDWVEVTTAGDGSKQVYVSLAFQDGFEHDGAPVPVASRDPVDAWLVVDGDGDGDDDLVAVSTASGQRVLEPLEAEQGSFLERSPTISSASAAGAPGAAYAVGDLDGDGGSDFIEIAEIEGEALVFATLGTDSGFIQSSARYRLPFDQAATAWFAVDLNRDGRSDLVAYRYWYDTDHHHGFHILTSR